MTEGTMKNRWTARQMVKQNRYDSKMRIGVAKTDVSMATNWNLSKIVMIKWNKNRRGTKMRLNG